MTRSLCTLFLCCLFSPPIHAGSVEVSQWIPWGFLTKEVSGKSFSRENHEALRTLDFGELKPEASEFSWKVNGLVSSLNVDASGIELSQELHGEISFTSLNIDQFVVRHFGGNSIQVRLKANCSSFFLALKGFNVKARFGFSHGGNLWRPSLSDLSINIPPNSWTVTSINCSGIGGIGEEITTSLNEILQNPNAFTDELKDWLGSEILTRFDSLWDNLVNSSGSDLMITGMTSPSDAGFSILALLPLRMNKEIKLPLVMPSNLSRTSPQLLLSREGFEAILQDKFLELAPQNYDLQKVSGFRKLMRSKLLQYIVWPDLSRFPSTNAFPLSLDLASSRLGVTPHQDGSWNAAIASNGVIRTSIGGSPIDYINFGMSVSTKLTVNLVNSELTLATGASSTKIVWSYGYLYQMLYRPNKRISQDLLTEAINQSFSQQKVIQKLPEIHWEGRTWKLQNWKSHINLITMDWL